MNILEPLCMDRRTKEQTQTYVIMHLCLKRTDEHTRTFMYGQKNKRTNPILCHYVLMSKRTEEQAQTFMCRQKNKRT